jgi:putative membrane protein
MPRATTYFTSEQRKAIESAVAEAENMTSAEIVPVVAAASGRYDRPEDIVGLFLGVVLMGIAWGVLPGNAPTLTGSWESIAVPYHLPALILAMVLGYAVGAYIASRVEWLRMLFTPSNQMRDEVNARARQVFFDDRVHHTAGATGVLFFVSLYERTAVILADATITERLGQTTLDEICADLVRGIKDGDIATALRDSILKAGGKLRAVLPRESDDINELADTLVLLD